MSRSLSPLRDSNLEAMSRSSCSSRPAMLSSARSLRLHTPASSHLLRIFDPQNRLQVPVLMMYEVLARALSLQISQIEQEEIRSALVRNNQKLAEVLHSDDAELPERMATHAGTGGGFGAFFPFCDIFWFAPQCENGDTRSCGWGFAACVFVCFVHKCENGRARRCGCGFQTLVFCSTVCEWTHTQVPVGVCGLKFCDLVCFVLRRENGRTRRCGSGGYLLFFVVLECEHVRVSSHAQSLWPFLRINLASVAAQSLVNQKALEAETGSTCALFSSPQRNSWMCSRRPVFCSRAGRRISSRSMASPRPRTK